MLILILLGTLTQLIPFALCVKDDPNQVLQVLQKNDKMSAITEILSLEYEDIDLKDYTAESNQTRLILEVLHFNNRTSKISVIVKTIPNTKPLAQIIKKKKLFKNEINIYVSAISIINEVMANFNVTVMEPLIVKALGYRPYNELIFEDVTGQLDYTLGDRVSGLDMDHSCLAVRGLAKFHALSIVTNQEKDDVINLQHNKSILVKHGDAFEDYYNILYERFADVIELNWGPEWEREGKMIRKFSSQVQDRLREIETEEHSFPNALIIGKPSVRNTYYKYYITDLAWTDSTPIAVRFSDLQYSFFGSPLIDVQYFINTSPELEVLARYRTVLLWHYYDAFLRYLIQFGYNGDLPSEKDFKKEVRRTNFIGLTAAIEAIGSRFDPVDPNIEITQENKYSKRNSSKLIPCGIDSPEFSDYLKVILDQAIRDDLFIIE